MKILSRIYRNIARHTAEFSSNNLDLALRIMARDSSAEYINENMKQAKSYPERENMLLAAVRMASTLPGYMCEFGVYNGQSLRLIADTSPDTPVFGFDSFQGLPTRWRDGFDRGAFATKQPTFMQNNIRLIVGDFSESIPRFLKETSGDITFAHIDCDLYSSARCVLDHIADHLAPGAIIIFDEYMNYPGWQDHEHKALLEVAQHKDLNIHYLGYTSKGEQVMIKLEPRAGNNEMRKT